MGEGVVFELLQYPVLQVPPFADRLALVIPLLPAMHAMLGGAGSLVLEGHFLLDRIASLKPPFERHQQLRDVIVELRAREARGGRELRVVFDRTLPVAQDDSTPHGQMPRERGERRLDVSRIVHGHACARINRCCLTIPCHTVLRDAERRPAALAMHGPAPGRAEPRPGQSFTRPLWRAARPLRSRARAPPRARSRRYARR